MSQKIRNVAIIAHVDHGKTTLVDGLLKQGSVFRENQQEMAQELIMDSNTLEKERGITILAKLTSVFFGEYKVNIVDTPGHSDFSGEVERTLGMADGCILLVDAQEGVMPQTRFVLKKALELGFIPIVVVNKIDKDFARPEEVIEEINDLFLDLIVNEDQLNFQVVYAIGREGKAWKTLPVKEEQGQETTLKVIFDTIIEHVPPPDSTEDGGLQILVSSLDADNYLGKLVIGKVQRGVIKKDQSVVIVKESEKTSARVAKLFVTRGLGREEVEQVSAGDIAIIAGLPEAFINDTICDTQNIEPLPRTKISEPTLKITISPNNSPFLGKEGKFVNSRQIKERLEKELETNVALRVEFGNDFVVSGRGEMHLGVLIENMRREGFEFEVSKPQVIFKKDENGNVLEPVEELTVETPDEFYGKVAQEIGKRFGELTNMDIKNGSTRAQFKIPTRAILGLRSILITLTKGNLIMSSVFKEYAPMGKEIPIDRNGSLIAHEDGVALAYGLEAAQKRGATFIEPGSKVYRGMVFGINAKPEDLVINVAKTKHATNIRAGGTDFGITLTPPKQMTLEDYLNFIKEDELLEVTPKSLRVRKKDLNFK
jgi:GTP-binding protein